MKAPLGFTLSCHDHEALRLEGDNVSETIRGVLSAQDMDEVVAAIRPYIETQKVNCRIDLDLAVKLEEIAIRMGVSQPAKIAKALVEMHLRRH